jgi:hypothetical protein
LLKILGGSVVLQADFQTARIITVVLCLPMLMRKREPLSLCPPAGVATPFGGENRMNCPAVYLRYQRLKGRIRARQCSAVPGTELHNLLTTGPIF